MTKLLLIVSPYLYLSVGSVGKCKGVIGNKSSVFLFPLRNLSGLWAVSGIAAHPHSSDLGEQLHTGWHFWILMPPIDIISQTPFVLLMQNGYTCTSLWFCRHRSCVHGVSVGAWLWLVLLQCRTHPTTNKPHIATFTAKKGMDLGMWQWKNSPLF